MKNLKKQSDEELAELSEKFARLNIENRDDVIFDFEEDSKKMINNLNIRKLLNKDKKYIKQVKGFIMQIILQSYLKDIIQVGNKKVDRFKRFYIG